MSWFGRSRRGRVMADKAQARSKQPPPGKQPWTGRLLLALVMFTALGLVLTGIQWLAQPENLPLRTVRVQGELNHVSAEAIWQQVAPLAAEGFVHVDIERVRQMLEQQPWVRSAQVRRMWPDALLVNLREQQVLARWGESGLLNPEGKVFYPSERIAGALPVLRGPEGTSVMVTAQFIELQRLLWALQLDIAEVTMDERRAWRLQLANGLQLVLGRSEHPQRMQRFVRAWPQVLAPRSATLERIDLRYTNGFAVSFRQTVDG